MVRGTEQGRASYDGMRKKKGTGGGDERQGQGQRIQCEAYGMNRHVHRSCIRRYDTKGKQSIQGADINVCHGFRLDTTEMGHRAHHIQ